MARKSRYLGYVSAMKKGQAKEPALSIKGKLSQMKEKARITIFSLHMIVVPELHVRGSFY